MIVNLWQGLKKTLKYLPTKLTKLIGSIQGTGEGLNEMTPRLTSCCPQTRGEGRRQAHLTIELFLKNAGGHLSLPQEKDYFIKYFKTTT